METETAATEAAPLADSAPNIAGLAEAAMAPEPIAFPVVPVPAPRAPFKLERLDGPGAPVTKPLIRRFITYPLPEPYGELGWTASFWANISRDRLKELDGPELLRAMVSHNGWLDENGEPYPPASTEEFWTAIPGEVAAMLDQMAGEALSELPNFLAALRSK